MAACNEALAATDDPVEQGRFMLHRGSAHESLGDLESERLDQMLVGKYRPSWFVGYANAASLSELLGDGEGHYRLAETAIAAAPDNPSAYLELLFIQVNNDETSAYVEAADQVISLLSHPLDWPFEDQRTSYLMGILWYCLHINERHEEALRAYQSAEYMGLDESWFFHHLADLSYYHLGENHLERALATGMRPLSYDTQYEQDLHVVVSSSVLLERFDEAIAVATQYADVLDAAQVDLGTRNFLGWNLFLNDRSAQASAIMGVWAAWATAKAEAREPQVGYIWDTVAHVRAAVGDT